jgi:hypothetical protein
MTAAWNNYYVPGTIGEALEILQRYDGRARVVGGGTDLLVEARRGLRRPFEAIVDASRIGGLGSIVEDGEYIVIGCGVTHTTIVNDERIIRSGTCLSESCGVIGGPQVRNTGTLAGNVAHALPAGDGTIGLLALGGEVEIALGTREGHIRRPGPQRHRPVPGDTDTHSFQSHGRRRGLCPSPRYAAAGPLPANHFDGSAPASKRWQDRGASACQSFRWQRACK